MEFPRLVYKSESAHELARTADEFDRLIAAGWYATVPEALAGRHEQPIDDSPPTRAELEAKALELGLKFDGRNSDSGLSRMLTAALAQ